MKGREWVSEEEKERAGNEGSLEDDRKGLYMKVLGG